MCKALEYQRQTAKVIKDHCSRENFAHKYQLIGGSAADPPVNWPIDSQKCNIYLDEEGMYEVLFGSQQPLAKKLRKHCCNVMFLHIRQQLTDKLLEDWDTRIQAIENENVGLQGEITAYQA